MQTVQTRPLSLEDAKWASTGQRNTAQQIVSAETELAATRRSGCVTRPDIALRASRDMRRDAILGPNRILRFKKLPRFRVFQSTFEVFTRTGADNSLERFTERSVGLVTDRSGDIDELFVTLL